ncbi:ankyrin repeat-containing protein At5g02620 isoform X2 [Jatropha curcas]|uniref:ankyrin repeat-containing protein At5g02620 isoform X2 n=1 Tax=Jatropha curcas TaxID=180498 RepID=UPI0009D67364|nr:ankyrin repeat-containing protein At5g02620 isoform X2 [Jatropha curcas]
MADIEQGQERTQAQEKRKRRLLMYKAAMSGDWEMVKDIFITFPEEAKAKVNTQGETILHIAVVAMHTHFVKQLVQILSKEDLAMRKARKHIQLAEDGSVHSSAETESGNTAFWYAARSGNLEVVQVMMEKNPDLAKIRSDVEKKLPICTAARYGHRKMVRYLYDATKDQMEEDDLIDLLINLVHTQIYALEVVEAHPLLVTKKDARTQNSVLHEFARKSHITSVQNSTILSSLNRFGKKNVVLQQEMELLKTIWEKITTQVDDIDISYLMFGSSGRVIFIAAEHGNVEFLMILAGSYPDVLLKVNENAQTIFHIAVLKRFENIFKLIHELGSIKDLINGYVDGNGNNMLHLAGYLPSSNRLNFTPGAALQLQHELVWFEEVMKAMSPQLIDAKNYDGLTPREVFLEEHKELRKEGEEWMRNTANSCMVVATLIATVVFASAFTVPGGHGQDNGIPIFLELTTFKVFIVSDAISLVFSVSTVLSFLSILTSRYSIDDFRMSLPTKLILGLSFLFISILAMMIAFIATFFIIFKHGQLKFAYPVAVIASVPIFLFIWQHALLFYQVIRSTFISSLLFRPNKNRLFRLESQKSKKSD